MYPEALETRIYWIPRLKFYHFFIDNKPVWQHIISSKPAQLFLDNKRPFVDFVDGQMNIDNGTIVLRHRIILPSGFQVDHFRFVGKYWRVVNCQRQTVKGRSSLVSFSKVS